MVEIGDLVAGYGRRGRGTRALDRVSLRLHRGQTVALVGESGSGKSTLAWALAGLHPSTSGVLRYLDSHAGTTEPVDGDLVRAARKRRRDLRRRVQMVFQNADTSLNPRREVSSAIRRPMRFFGTPRRETDRALADLLDDVQLPPELVRRLPGQLSGGQRQRVAIARALAARPDVLVADEITTALDVSVQASILERLDDLRREHNLACLFISHDLAVVHDVADHVVVLYGGRVVESGPTAAVFAGPNHPYTRQLLSATLEPDPVRARAVVERGALVEAGAVLAGSPGDEGPPPGAGEWSEEEGTIDLGHGHVVRRWRRVASVVPAGVGA